MAPPTHNDLKLHRLPTNIRLHLLHATAAIDLQSLISLAHTSKSFRTLYTSKPTQTSLLKTFVHAYIPPLYLKLCFALSLLPTLEPDSGHNPWYWIITDTRRPLANLPRKRGKVEEAVEARKRMRMECRNEGCEAKRLKSEEKFQEVWEAFMSLNGERGERWFEGVWERADVRMLRGMVIVHSRIEAMSRFIEGRGKKGGDEEPMLNYEVKRGEGDISPLVYLYLLLARCGAPSKPPFVTRLNRPLARIASEMEERYNSQPERPAKYPNLKSYTTHFISHLDALIGDPGPDAAVESGKVFYPRTSEFIAPVRKLISEKPYSFTTNVQDRFIHRYITSPSIPARLESFLPAKSTALFLIRADVHSLWDFLNVETNAHDRRVLMFKYLTRRCMRLVWRDEEGEYLTKTERMARDWTGVGGDDWGVEEDMGMRWWREGGRWCCGQGYEEWGGRGKRERLRLRREAKGEGDVVEAKVPKKEAPKKEVLKKEAPIKKVPKKKEVKKESKTAPPTVPATLPVTAPVPIPVAAPAQNPPAQSLYHSPPRTKAYGQVLEDFLDCDGNLNW